MNTFTMHEALNHHGIGTPDMSEDTLTDTARQAGVVSVCLGCGSIVGMGSDWEGEEETRKAYAERYDFSCCADSDDILF